MKRVKISNSALTATRQAKIKKIQSDRLLGTKKS
jgi:hypothetical protein